MTISVTTEPAFAPPRMRVDVGVDAGDVMTSVALWRTDSTGRSLVRTQPSAGFDSRTVYDYECPYGQNVTYDWEASYYDPALSGTTFSEPWSSFPGSWTGNTANASIASNRVTLTGLIDTYRSLLRSGLNAAWDTITIARLAIEWWSSPLYGLRLAFGATELVLGTSGTNLLIQRSTGITSSTIPTGIDASQPFTITRNGNEFVIVGTNGSTTVSSTLSVGNLASIRIESGPVAETPINAVVGAITVKTFASLQQIAETATPAALNPVDVWLVAPQAPALSVRVSGDPRSAEVQVRDISAIRNQDRKSYHSILGVKEPITTASGPGGPDEFTIELRTRTADQEAALLALWDKQLPVLVRTPPALGYDIPDGFYSIGELRRARVAQLPSYPARIITLPLVAVASPDVDVENVGWSWAALAAEFSSWNAVKAAYATWADVAVDNRRPGF